MKLFGFLLLISFGTTSGFAPNQHWERLPRVLHAQSTTAEIPTEWQGEVLKKLKTIIDPDLGADIVSLGFVQNLKLEDQKVLFDVELTTPACPVKDQFAADCDRLVRELSWVSDVQVTMTAQENVRETNTFGMQQIGSVIAVSSCKGGVGKSTTAVNLAFALQSQGATVGIFDADVYGPSLPTMVKPDDDIVRFVGRQIAPLQRNGVRLMSFGYVNDGSAVMRGPMVTQLLDQFLSVTQWGALDYLIIDMPPGTGDIQLTLTQRLNITAAVIVTTPQELSFADVVRGVEMFDSVNVPSVAVVENMAYYEVKQSKPTIDREALRKAFADRLTSTPGFEAQDSEQINQLTNDLISLVEEKTQTSESSERVQIFGAGHRERLSKQWGIEHTFSVPLLDQIATNGDSGLPFVLGNPDSPQAAIYKDLAKAVVSEVAKVKYSGTGRPDIVYNKEANKIEVDGETIAPSDLRRGCRCAACVEELTGRQLLIPSSISENMAPLRMNPTGNYALSVDWADGHRSLYPYRQIRSMLEEQKANAEKKEAVTA
eukprot:scaffold877_cov154-Amphora_coffeaeformis.AAC.16